MDYSNSTASVFMQIYDKTAVYKDGRTVKTPFVIIIDEWDCVIREFSDKPELVHEYLQFLHSLFKSEESQSYMSRSSSNGLLVISLIGLFSFSGISQPIL